MVHRYLLRWARADEGTTAHWPIPSGQAEQDPSTEAYRRLAACTACLDDQDLVRDYGAAWAWAKALAGALAETYGIDPDEALIEALDRRLADWFPASSD